MRYSLAAALLLSLSLASCGKPPEPKPAAPAPAAPAEPASPSPAAPAGPSSISEWIRFTSEQKSYVALVPAQPQCRSAKVPQGDAFVCVFAGEQGAFMITEISAPLLKGSTREAQGAFLDRALSDIPDAKIAQADAIEIDGHLGRFATAVGPQGPFSMAFFVRGETLLTFVGAPNPKNPASAALVSESVRAFRPLP